MSELDTWHELESCGSTNDEVARLARAGARSGTVVIAKRQTAGRGRQGRAWETDEGNLFGSILLRPQLPLTQVSSLSLVVGLAARAAVRRLWVEAQIKWPNDLVVGRRKLGGILCEASSRGSELEYVVAGIGINIDSVPADVRDRATSIAENGGAQTSPASLMRSIAAELDHRIDRRFDAMRAELLEAWRDRDRPARWQIDGGVIQGTARDIDDAGALIIEDADGARVAVVAGEVEIDYA